MKAEKRAENGFESPEYWNFDLDVEILVEISKKKFVFGQNEDFEKGLPKCFRDLNTYFFGF